jgi:SAM-dependent methyltransferase
LSYSLEEIRAHWERWAKTFGTDFRATTRTQTIKLLEVDALSRALAAIHAARGRSLSILEAGCGNGHNSIQLALDFPDCRFSAFDYVDEMVEAACALRTQAGLDERLTIFRDDVLELANVTGSFDVIISVRCLINLNTDALQMSALSSLAQRVAAGGNMLLIENNHTTYGKQNEARASVGLPERTPAEFNRFFDEAVILPHLDRLGFDVATEDFASLHDLMLYVLLPMLSDGKIEYDHPMMEAVTQLSLALNRTMPNPAGSFGQNRLYLCSRRD